MSLGDGATRAEEIDDLFPVRDIETNRPDVLLSPRKLRSSSNKREKNDFYSDFERFTLPEIGSKLYELAYTWYTRACSEASHATNDLKNSWVETTGKYSTKTKITSRLLMYYLIILALYIIRTYFWVIQILLQGLYKTVLNSERNTQMLIGLGIVFSLIVMAYVIGAPYCPEPATSTDP